jgi:two-component system, OmpR family, response regulator
MVEEGTAAPEASEHVRFGGFTLDVGGYTLTGPGGREVPLRRAEFALLQAFLRAPGRVLSRDHLLGSVAGRPCASYDRTWMCWSAACGGRSRRVLGHRL